MKQTNIVFGRLPFSTRRKDGEPEVNFEDLLTGLVSTVYKLDIKGKIAELQQNGEPVTTATLSALLLDTDKTRVKTFTEGKTGKFQEGYAKAKSEERDAFEAEIKLKYGIESDLKNQELIDHIIKTKAAETATTSGKKPSELTVDEIKALPAFHTIEKTLKADFKVKEDALNQKYTELETNQKRETVFSKFASKAMEEVAKKKPLMPKNPEVANNLQSVFLNSFKDYEIRENEDGSYTFLKDGKVVEDAHGHSLGWLDMVNNTASKFYEFEQSNGGGNAGNSNTAGKTTTTTTPQKKGYPDGYKPTTLAELGKITKDTTIDPVIRGQVSEAWNAEHSATG